MTYTSETGFHVDAYDTEEMEKNERTGVLHVVHGWIQQNQKKKARLFYLD